MYWTFLFFLKFKNKIYVNQVLRYKLRPICISLSLVMEATPCEASLLCFPKEKNCSFPYAGIVYALDLAVLLKLISLIDNLAEQIGI